MCVCVCVYIRHNILTNQWKLFFFLKVCPEVFQGHISSLSEALPRDFGCKSSPVRAQADEASGPHGGSLQVPAAGAVCVPGPLGLERVCPAPQEPRHPGPLVRSWWTVPVLLVWGQLQDPGVVCVRRKRKPLKICCFCSAFFGVLTPFYVSFQREIRWCEWDSVVPSSEFTVPFLWFLPFPVLNYIRFPFWVFSWLVNFL